MRIGVISDTHGSLSGFRTAYNRVLADCDLIVHCGDILYHGPRNPLPDSYDPRGLAQALNSVLQPVVAVRGNCDADVDQKMLDFPILSQNSNVYVDGLRILVQHGEDLDQKSPPGYINRSHCDILLYGHTHSFSTSVVSGVTWANPGSPALPKSSPELPTVATIEERVFRVVDITNGETLLSTRVP